MHHDELQNAASRSVPVADSKTAVSAEPPLAVCPATPDKTGGRHPASRFFVHESWLATTRRQQRNWNVTFGRVEPANWTPPSTNCQSCLARRSASIPLQYHKFHCYITRGSSSVCQSSYRTKASTNSRINCRLSVKRHPKHLRGH